jgi:hypothetical protein
LRADALASDEVSVVVVSSERTTMVPSFDVSQLAHDSDRWSNVESSAPPPAPDPPEPGGSVLIRAADFYWSRLGGREFVPVLKIPLEAIEEQHRVHCEGFILCRIDGVTTLADIIETSGLPELTALSLACDLVDEGILATPQGGESGH